MQASNKSSDPVSHEQTAQLARQLWEQAGQPDGQDLEFWTRAEQQLTGALKTKAARLAPGESRSQASSLDVLGASAAKGRAGNGARRERNLQRA